MKKNILLLTFGFTLLMVMLLVNSLMAVNTVSGAIVYLTPTPDARGRIVYVVQEGDSCISIALINGIPLEDLRLLNNKESDNCVVYPGEELLLAIIEEPTPLPDAPTATPIFPTPTPFEGYVEICIHLYEDVNGNSVRDDEITEPLLGNGAASITDPLKLESWTGQTVANEELCFEELPAGEFNISIAVPEGYNSTTNNSSVVNMKAGDTTIVNFGAQQGSQMIGEEDNGTTNTTNDGGRNPLLALVGGLMLVGGGGLGLYMAFNQRNRKHDMFR